MTPPRKLLLLAILCACGADDRGPAREVALDSLPVDAGVLGSADDAAGWGYRRRLEADLDGDGVVEVVVMAADVEVLEDGTPLWEDGHRWAAFVEPNAGSRTLLYAAFVPNGFAEAAVLEPGADGRRAVLVQERAPRRVRVLNLEFDGPGTARLISAVEYRVEWWLPGSARHPGR
jgi:hypothetical protein